MSAFTGPAPGSPNPDEVSVQIGAVSLQGWQTVNIGRSCETMPNNWAVTASTEFMQGPALSTTRPGQACKILIGTDLVITGWIDRRTITADAHNHVVTLTGRGITRNLVDCSADLLKDPGLKGGFISATSTLDLAQRLCRSFKLTARSAVSDLGLPIPAFQVALGETPYEIIESVARYAGYLVFEDENGDLVLDRVGTQSMSSGFTMPGNIEAITGERSVDGRYSDYLVVWSAIDQLSDLSNIGNQQALVEDDTLTEYRPLIMVSAQPTNIIDFGQKMAAWEKARRIGRSQAAFITCDSWRDEQGKLWTPNWLATVEAPGADITGANWIIGSVTFRKDGAGTHADLTLMPPHAFDPQPNPLNLFDNELTNSPQTSQTPAPPSTDPPGDRGPGLG